MVIGVLWNSPGNTPPRLGLSRTVVNHCRTGRMKHFQCFIPRVKGVPLNSTSRWIARGDKTRRYDRRNWDEIPRIAAERMGITPNAATSASLHAPCTWPIHQPMHGQCIPFLRTWLTCPSVGNGLCRCLMHTFAPAPYVCLACASALLDQHNCWAG